MRPFHESKDPVEPSLSLGFVGPRGYSRRRSDESGLLRYRQWGGKCDEDLSITDVPTEYAVG
jgi:hypothetical protein